MPLDNLLDSFIHMCLNRIFKTQQRKCEMIIYDFMYQYYTTQIFLLQKKLNHSPSSLETIWFHGLWAKPEIGANGDKDCLIQVVINLILNAVKFTDLTKASIKGNHIAVQLKDSGNSISKVGLPKIFPFYSDYPALVFNSNPRLNISVILANILTDSDLPLKGK